jgi:hypothetical protein
MRTYFLSSTLLLAVAYAAHTHHEDPRVLSGTDRLPVVENAGKLQNLPAGDNLAIGTGTYKGSAAELDEPLGGVGSGPAALYIPSGTLGLGWPTPGTFFDSRHNFVAGWDDAEWVEAGPNTINGVEIDYVRSYGTLMAPTSTDWTTEISRVTAYGYTTGNTVASLGSERWIVDQHNTSSAVPGRFNIFNTDAGGTQRRNFHFDSAGHFASLQVTAPALTSCGTGASIVGSDQGGTITEGTGATGCTLTFFQSWSTTFNAPPVHCTVTGQSGLLTYTESATQIVITNVGPLSSTNIDYTCIAAGPP